MTEVSETARAMHFRARHEKGAVGFSFYSVRQGLIKARPAGATFELCVRREERQIATRTDESAFALFFVERAAARALCAVLAEHHVLVGRKPFSPIHIGQVSVVDRFGRCHWSRLTEFGRTCER